MTQALIGERTLMRIHVLDADRHDGQPLAPAIVRLLRERGFSGATAVSALMGFGASRTMHSQRNELEALRRPVVVECVDTEERIRDILPALDAMIGSGLITLERADVRIYRALPGAEAQP